MSGTRETETTSEMQNGETFNDEMKDYAKSTMNELLGMFGYEEEITREAVEELQIRLLPEEDEEHMQQGNDEPSTCKPTPADGNTPMAVDKHADKPPVVVQVEGCDSGSSTSSLPVSNGKGVVETCTPPLVAVPMPSAPQLAVAVEGVTTDPPSSTNKPATALDQTVGNDVCSSSDWTEKKGSNAQPSSSVCVTYTSPSNKTHIQNLGQCMWCKQTALLQDFSSSDGERRISCKGLCSALCFEKAVKNMKKSNTSPKETQKQLRVPQPNLTKSDGNITKPAPEGSRSEGSPSSSSPGSSSKKSSPTAPLTRSAARGFAASVGPQRNPNLFSWDDYLAKTGAEAAPWNCFKQSSTPPYNGFKCGMKLEVADPRIVDTMCVATVVGILGPRIRCRFDGTDSANDVWHLVDSKEIHPVGWCEGNGGRLQPPVGFKSDPGKYSTFLAKSLASAEMAPVRLFKREPTSPKANSFKTGMKLEALDPKNPLLICVATVADTDGDKIRVDFDGYLGSDYWCRFDSRDVFPVGWCYFSGHPLQPPGKTKKALKAVLSTKTKEKPDKQDKPDKTDKLAKQEKQEKPEKQDKKKTPPAPPPQFVPASTVTVPTPTPTITSPSSTSAAKQSSSPVQVDADDGSTSPTTVQVFINHSCHAGPYLNQAQVAGLPSCFRGSVANVARDCIQSVVNAALDPKVVFGFLKPGNGRTKIVARTGSKTLSCMLQHIDRVSIFWRVLEKFSDNLQCCENLFCGERMTGACPKCGRSASRRNTVLPETRVPANNSSPSGSLKRHHATDDKREGGKYSRINIDDDDVSSPQVCSSSHPKTWTVDEVVKFIESSELAEHSDMFRNHEIDGKALLLLTREMIMSYMGLKLGPAIKLLCFIDELKVQKGI